MLLGRVVGDGLVEEINVGTGLELTGNTLNATAVGVSDVSALTTTGLTSGNMLRVKIGGGIEERTPSQVLSDIGAATSSQGETIDYLMTQIGSAAYAQTWDFASATQGGVADAVAATIAGYGDIVTWSYVSFASAAQGITADSAALAIASYGNIVTHNSSDFATPSDVSTAILDHVSATDPHGDRGYADSVASGKENASNKSTSVTTDQASNIKYPSVKAVYDWVISIIPTWSTLSGKPSTFAPIIGTGAADAVAGNDSRLTAPRTPTAHKSSHATGGSDVLLPSDIGAITADGTASTLRSVRSSGYNQLVDSRSKLWRIIEKMRRDTSHNGISVNNRFRAVSFGDSVACVPIDQIHSFWGYGGIDTGIIGWVKESQPSPVDTSAGNYTSWSSSGTGVFTLSDEWTRTMKGPVIHLDAAKTGGTYIENTNVVNSYMLHSVFVHYLAGTGYGNFKLQYKTNGVGSWTDCTTATVSTGGGSQSAGVVSSNNSGAETYSQAVFTLPALDYYHLRIIATSGRAYLCAALHNAGAFATGAPSGSAGMTGGLVVDCALGGRGISSHFSLWNQSVMAQGLGFIDPHVVIYKSANEWSLVNYQTYWPALAAKIHAAAPNALLIVCGSHPRNVAPNNLDAGDIAVDDYLRDYCSTDQGAIFVDVRQNFPIFNRQISVTAAAGFTGSSDTNGIYDMDGLQTVAGLSYYKWKRISGGHTCTITPTGSGSFTGWELKVDSVQYYTTSVTDTALGGPVATYPSTSITWATANGASGTLSSTFYQTADSLWSDGIHIYGGTAANWGGGQNWVNNMVWNAIKPACEAIISSSTTTRGYSNILPMVPTEIRLWDTTSVGSQANHLGFTVNPRYDSQVAIRPSGAFFNGGTGIYGSETGFYASSNFNATCPGALTLMSNGLTAITFGSNTAGNVLQGFTVGVNSSNTTNLARSTNGYRFKSVWSVYGVNTGLVAEARSDSNSAHRLFGLDIGATDSAAGTKLWSWNIGSASVLPQVIYHGRTNDSNQTTYTYEEPVAAVTVHNPVCATAGSGAFVKVVAMLPSYADSTAASAALSSGEVYYDEATKKVKAKP